jgi:hydroxymethylglutaryl-CoA synthase
MNSVGNGIVEWGTYIPYFRLERKAIGATLGGPAGRGSRSVASFDEDTTSMGVEAARQARRGPVPETLLFSTPAPAYLDKTNATALHAALGLGAAVGAYDMCGSVRSAWGAMIAAQSAPRPTLVVTSDLRTGLASGADERDSGDGAAAFVWAADGVVAEVIGSASASDEFLDRWRAPGEPTSHLWEERFGEQVYVPIAAATFAAAIKDAGLTPDAIDHAIVTGLHSRAVRVTAAGLGLRSEAFAPDLTASIGNLGAAHAGVALADVLERAQPGQVIVVLQLADGADAMVLRTTDALTAAQAGRTTVAEQIAAGRSDLSYATFLTWRGQLVREPPRRPDPEAPAAPPAHRTEQWKYAFVASRCTQCGTRHLPPTRVCLSCHAMDEMEPETLADAKGTVATFTVDRLAFSLSPPVVAAIVDFDGGGRFGCEMTDVDPAAVAIGDRVEMTFRRLFTAGGIHNYFWKARPERS